MKINQKINNYTILAKCGKGSFGTVYLAKRDDGKYVALKEISLIGSAGERELQAIASYKSCPSSPFLLQILDLVVDEEDDKFYYTMELADNILGLDSKEYKPCTLETILCRHNTLNVVQTREIVCHLLDGLSVLHQNNFVHRDIKPGNIVWINGVPKLGDIGLLANENSMTFRAGSDGFMPIYNSPILPNSKAVDLYALTRLIFCCLSGKSAKHYMDWEIPTEVKIFGRDLLKLMLLSDKELSLMDINDFKNLLTIDDEPMMDRKCCMPPIIGCFENRCYLRQELKLSISSIEDNLNNLSCLANLVSVQSWLDNQKLTPNILQNLVNEIPLGYEKANVENFKARKISSLCNLVKDFLSKNK